MIKEREEAINNLKNSAFEMLHNLGLAKTKEEKRKLEEKRKRLLEEKKGEEEAERKRKNLEEKRIKKQDDLEKRRAEEANLAVKEYPTICNMPQLGPTASYVTSGNNPKRTVILFCEERNQGFFGGCHTNSLIINTHLFPPKEPFIKHFHKTIFYRLQLN